ncbi:pyrroline-5-carboxylate reductase [Janibacter sp. RAF20_2_2]|uniref:Pyrroline-5-carboxylate reductase n=1 Tax=Janibacter hoylei PVAS-1 TaxID=1210046 RepID=A0A444B8S5_9MICO|nr:pyrroline-5-carboxylate reductase [Janibacter hoylei]RWU84815.1 pyrroline-5-carboxylate reductase [Janibacter hoylei PVAS-1]
MTTAIYGVGAMGGAILDGLTTGGDGEVLAVVRTPERAAELRERYADRPGVEVVDALAAAARADVHLVVVKPYAVADLLAQVRDSLRPGSVVVSLALGVSLADLAAALPDGVAAVRGMPNTPARVGQGMTVLSPAADVTAEQLQLVRDVLAPTGATLVLPEAQQGAATALSGSAPAYFYLVVEAMVDAGVARGLTRADALALAGQAARGAGAMLVETGEEAALLRAQVTSPGGSTAAALARLEAHGVRHALADAVAACAERAG